MYLSCLLLPACPPNVGGPSETVWFDAILRLEDKQDYNFIIYFQIFENSRLFNGDDHELTEMASRIRTFVQVRYPIFAKDHSFFVQLVLCPAIRLVNLIESET